MTTRRAVRGLGVAGAMLLAACGGEGAGPSGPPVPAGGPDLDVNRGEMVTLAGSATDPDGQPVTLTWTQISGPSVGALAGANPSFPAPNDIVTLEFDLTAEAGQDQSTDRVVVRVLDDKAHALWVAPNGNDANPGTRTQPKATIQGAIDASTSSGDVYVASGTFSASLTLRTGVSVYGGFNPTTWLRNIATNETIVSGGTTAVSGAGVSALTLDGLTIRSASAVASAVSSVAILLDASTTVVITNNRVIAGNGANGANGPVGTAAVAGSPGDSGTSACVFTTANGEFDCPGGRGGLGGAGAASGGGGGSGFYQSPGYPGGKGFGIGGGDGGSGGTTPPSVAGGVGGPGASGGSGPDGTSSASDFGALSGSVYSPSSGTGGATGKNGVGGGGGGGGWGYEAIVNMIIYSHIGGGGGGGGGGGFGGAGGAAGAGGGGSFAIILANASSATISNNTITTGSGGQGGSGAEGREGGAGGAGGQAGGAGIYGTGVGGAGGPGGAGGHGGAGGGGGGGPSIGLVEDAGSSSNVSVGNLAGNTFTLGAGGTGGAHATGGQPSGATGRQANVLKL